VTAAFDQAGGGKQYQIDWDRLAKENGVTVGEIKRYKNGGIDWLVKNGYLDRLTPEKGIPPK
jgi:hypothetical protein